MNFNDVIDSKNYFTLSEAKLFRQNIWKSIDVILKQLNQELFDELSIEESISITNDFLDKNIYSINKVDVVVSLTKEQFEHFIDQDIISKYISDNINYYVYILDENIYYNYNDFFFKEKKLEIDIKLNYE